MKEFLRLAQKAFVNKTLLGDYHPKTLAAQRRALEVISPTLIEEIAPDAKNDAERIDAVLKWIEKQL